MNTKKRRHVLIIGICLILLTFAACSDNTPDSTDLGVITEAVEESECTEYVESSEMFWQLEALDADAGTEETASDGGAEALETEASEATETEDDAEAGEERDSADDGNADGETESQPNAGGSSGDMGDAESASGSEPESESESGSDSGDEPAEAYTYTAVSRTMYAKTYLNVRSGPCKSADRIGVLSYGQQVTVTGQCNETGWYRIEYGNGVGYCSNNYLVSTKPESKYSTNSGSSKDNGTSGKGNASGDSGSSDSGELSDSSKSSESGKSSGSGSSSGSSKSTGSGKSDDGSSSTGGSNSNCSSKDGGSSGNNSSSEGNSTSGSSSTSGSGNSSESTGTSGSGSSSGSSSISVIPNVEDSVITASGITLEVEGSVSGLVRAVAKSELSRLPSKMAEKFVSDGWRIVITDQDIASTYATEGEFEAGTVYGVIIYADKIIYIQNCLLRDYDNGLYTTALHEMGHWFDVMLSYDGNHYISYEDEFLALYEEEKEAYVEVFGSEVIDTNKEFFAQCFYRYITEPDELGSACPGVKAWFDNAMSAFL